MRDLATKTAVCFALLIAAASGAWAQGLTFTRPAATPRTEVNCTTCPPANSAFNRRSVGYDGAISKYVGRFLDSTFTGDYQSAPRTIRAQQIKYDARRKRFFMQFGGGLAVSYDAAGLINRLNAGSPMTTVSANRPGALTLEKFLPYDAAFYAETDGWTTPVIDGQEFLKGIDFDDRNNVYLAYTVFGWGIVKDTTTTPGGQGLMQNLSQITQPANQVFSVKTSDGKYYALVASGQLRTGVWDVTDPANPVEVRVLSRLFYSLTRSSDGRYVAAIDASDGKVHVFTAEALVNGFSSFTSHAVPNPARAWVSLTAGANNDFYALEQGPNAAVRILHLAVNNSTATPTLMTTTAVMQATKINYGDGFLTVVGSDANNQYDLRVFRLPTPSTLTEVETLAYVDPNPAPQANLGGRTSYFTRFYADVPQHSTRPYARPENIRFDDAIVYKHTDGKTYLIVGLKGLGDVYEIKGADGIAGSYKGVTGTANPHSQQPAGTDPVYGDTIVFGSTFTASAPFNVTWDFDNAGTSGNVISSLSGNDVSHQYSGLTAAQLATPRAVKVSRATDPSVSDTVSLTMKVPVPRVAVAGSTAPAFTSAASMSGAQLVVGDLLLDASDGRVEGHFSEWIIDGVATRSVPYAGMPSGTTCGAHTLVFNGHYGPYVNNSSTITPGPAPLVVSMNGSYTLRPFIAAIGVAGSNATNIVFASQSRQTANTTVLPQGVNTPYTYKWSTVNAAGTVVHELPAATSTLSNVPNYTVPKSIFTSASMKVRLLLDIGSAYLSAACGGYATQTVETAALNPPDPVLVATGCTYVGQPCTVTVNSTGDQSGWTYAWTLNNEPQPAVTGRTFTPTLPIAGQYIVGLVATNAISSVTAQALPLSIAVPPCSGTPTQSNLSVGYNCGTAPCSPSNRTVRFQVYSWGYNFNATCDTYLWNFGDGSTSNQRDPSHTYAAAGTYNTTFTITSGGNSATFNQQVVFSGTGGGNGGGGGGGGGGSTCLVMQQNSVFITYQGPSTGCSAVNTSATPCSASESVQFGVSEFGYNLGCGTHTYQWNFGDNTTSNLGRNVSHQFPGPGTYNVSVTVTPPSGIGVTVSQPVVVGGTTGGGTCPVPQSNNFVMNMQGSVSGCSANQRNCFTTDNIAFNINPTGAYNIACGTHSYTWNFGDGTGGNGQAPTHRYSQNGTYTVTATVQNSAGQAVVALAGTISVTTPSGGGSCPVPTANNLFITFNGPSGCSQSNAKPCEGSELVRLQVDPYLYNFNCGTHTYTWNFGDGTQGSGRIVDHSFAPSSAPYNVQVTVNNGSGQITLTQPVSVTSGGGSGNPGGVNPTVAFTAAAFPSVPNGMIFTPTVTPSGSVNRWVWSFGDGSESTVTGTTPTPAIHPYAQPGTYTVTLTTSNGITQFPPVSQTVVVGGGTNRQRPTRRR